MYQFMGGYISCLMEYGELPSKGVTDPNVDQHKQAAGGGKVCDSKFAGFNIVTGRPPISSTAGSSSSKSSLASQSASGGKNSSSSASEASTKSSDSKSKSGSESNGNNSNGSNSSRENTNSPYANGSLKRSSGSDSGSIADGSSTSENGKVKVINQDDSDAARRGRLGDESGRSSRRTIYDRSQYRAITGQELAEIEKQNKPPRTPSTATIPIDEDGRIGPRKTTFSPPENKPAALEKADDNQMNFGYFMKWLIIAAMAIAIFLFFGSQVMSFMNSQEK